MGRLNGDACTAGDRANGAGRRSRDGVGLAYTDVGQGPALVLVHGITCDRRHFDAQVAYFCRRHRVVAVDLRGHGESDAPQQDYSPALFAQDLHWLCTQLEIESPIVVGHSMGGIVALELAARFPDFLRAIALLDSPIFVPAAYRSVAEMTVEVMAGPQGLAAWQLFLRASFSRLDDPARRDAILQAASKTPAHVLASCFRGAWAWDEEEAIRRCRVPILYVRSATFIDLERMRLLCPRLVTGETVGSGHFALSQVPEQVNSMLERFILSLR